MEQRTGIQAHGETDAAAGWDAKVTTNGLNQSALRRSTGQLQWGDWLAIRRRITFNMRSDMPVNAGLARAAHRTHSADTA